MKRCLLILCFASFFVDAAKRKLEFQGVSEEPSQKTRRSSQGDAFGARGSSLSILADLVPLFLHFSGYRLAHSLSQVNRACFKAVCMSSFEATKKIPRISMAAKSLDLAVQPEQIILNFAFQYLNRAKETNLTTIRREKLASLVRILTKLNSKDVCMAVTGMLISMKLGKFEINAIFQLLTIVHKHREVNGRPTPYLTVYPKIMMGGFESFSEQINIEIVRMLTYRDNPEMPAAYAKNTAVYHKFFQDMFLLFPEFCAQKYQELLDTEESCPLAGYYGDYTAIFRDIMGPFAGLVTADLDYAPLWIRARANNFDYLWKLVLNKLTFLPWRNAVQINANVGSADSEIFEEIGQVLKLVGALETSDAFSFEGLSDIQIFHMMNYITHSIQVDESPEYVRSVAAKLVNAEDSVTPLHLRSILYLAGFFVYQLIEEKLSALPSEECVLEHLKFLGPTTILDYIRHHTINGLPQSFRPLLLSNLQRIALGDKEMARKYDDVHSFMAKSFPDEVAVNASFIVTAALSDKLLSDEKTLLFLFDQIPGMTVLLRENYDSLLRIRKARTE